MQHLQKKQKQTEISLLLLPIFYLYSSSSIAIFFCTVTSFS